MIHTAVSKCDVQLAPELYERVLLTGGNMSFPGMAQRIQKELDALVATDSSIDAKVKVTVKRLPSVPSWTGGSLIGVLSGFKSLCTTWREYAESGPSFIHRKCVYS